MKVRERGLEPRHLSVLDPKSSASTNSAILAIKAHKMIQILIKRMFIKLYSEMIYESKIACKYNLTVIVKQITLLTIITQNCNYYF